MNFPYESQIHVRDSLLHGGYILGYRRTAVSNNMQKSSLFGLLTVVGLLAIVPVVYANPITPSLTWSPQFVPIAGTTTGTANVAIDADCPSGKTYQGTITVVEPDGVSTGTVTIGATPCGTAVTVVYPTGFSGSASTSESGTYTATFAGTTSALVGGVHPKFSLTDNFFAGNFQPVPESPMPAMLMAAFGLVAVVAMRKTGKISFLS
jgi:hypothetical protein